IRSWVERGSMPYSAVTQPLPEPLRNGGAFSSRLAVTSTWVSPNLTRQEPSAWRAKPGVRETVRIWSGARVEGRMEPHISVVLVSGSVTYRGARPARNRNRKYQEFQQLDPGPANPLHDAAGLYRPPAGSFPPFGGGFPGLRRTGGVAHFVPAAAPCFVAGL